MLENGYSVNKKVLNVITRTRAIVLSHFRYGDNSLIVNIYTELLGRQTVFIKGAFSKKTPMRAGLFQPLYVLETEIHHRANRQMQRLSDMQILIQFQSIPFDPIKSSIALFIAEILNKTLREEEANPDLFDFLYHAIQTLDLSDKGVANFHLIFLLHYTKYLGFYPNTSYLSDNARFNIRKGGFEIFPTITSVDDPTNQLLSQLLETGFEKLENLQMNYNQRNNLTDFLLEYYSAHMDNFGKVKSLSVLQNVFHD